MTQLHKYTPGPAANRNPPVATVGSFRQMANCTEHRTCRCGLAAGKMSSMGQVKWLSGQKNLLHKPENHNSISKTHMKVQD